MDKSFAALNPHQDWVIFKVTDMADGHEQLVVAADVCEAASKVTQAQGPALRAYDRIAVIDRRPTTMPLEVAMA